MIANSGRYDLGFSSLLLGGSWVVISEVISRVAIIIAHIKGLTTPLITTHEPPSADGWAAPWLGLGAFVGVSVAPAMELSAQSRSASFLGSSIRLHCAQRKHLKRRLLQSP